MSLRREELAAAINAAHQRGLKVTGHLCAVGFMDAGSLGIDNPLACSSIAESRSRSTLAIYETFAANAQLDPRTLDMLTPALQDLYRAEQAKHVGGRCSARILLARRLWRRFGPAVD
jgi:hypothetical protein